MELLIVFLLLLLLFTCTPFLSKWCRKRLLNSVILATCIGAVLVPVTLFILNQYQLVLPQQSGAISWAAGLRRTAGNESAKKWAHQNFVFVDNSWSHQLIAAPGSNQLGNSTVSITDRKELASLLQFLSRQSKDIDLVVLDMLFDFPSPDDSLFREALTISSLKDKVILAKNPLNPNQPAFASLDPENYGSIIEEGEHQFFATYTAWRDKEFSLPYKVYMGLQSLKTVPVWSGGILKEKDTIGKGKMGINTYLPRFSLYDEPDLYQSTDETGKGESKQEEQNYFELGDLATQIEAGVFQEYLRKRKEDHLRNIVFVGSFKGPDADVHDTYFGKLHGPTVLLNLVYSLCQGQHHFSIGYLLYLWVGFTVIFYILCRSALHFPMFLQHRTLANAKHATYRSRFVEILKGMYEVVIVHQVHLWIFILFIVLTALLWGKIINGFLLLLLAEFIFLVFRYYAGSHGHH